MNNVLLADITVSVHLAFVLSLVVFQLLIVAGWLLGWSWTRNFWFRVVHLLSIVYVTMQAALRIDCPLTTLERNLRGGRLHDLEHASRIGRWANETLFFQNPPDILYFALGYAAFMLLVVSTWVFAPPRWPWGKKQTQPEQPEGGTADAAA